MSACLGKLDSAQRELLLLPYRGHGSVNELAIESGRSVNSLYKKIGRLREKLAKCIEVEMNSPGMKGELS